MLLHKTKQILGVLGIVFFCLPVIGLSEEAKEVKKEEKTGIFPLDILGDVVKGVTSPFFKLGEVVVTATRDDVRLRDVPASVSVIESEDIRMSPFQKTEDVLRTVPGVEVRMHYGVHTIAGTRPVNIRGVGGYGDRTLVLVDGVPQNNANNGWVEWSQIPLDYVERIEVVKGPFSALYGSNAMGGVINIITKKPSKDRETVIEEKYGSLSTWSTKVIQSQKIGRVGYYISGKYEDTDGYIATKPQQSYDIKRYRKENNYIGNITFDLDDISELIFGFSSYHVRMGRGREFFYGKTKNQHFYSNYERNDEDVHFLATLYINDDEWDANFDKATSYDYLYRNEVIPMKAVGSIVQADIDLADWNKLTLGVDYKHNKIEKEDEYFTVERSGGVEGKQHCVSIFFHDDMRFFNDRLILNLGGRFDWIKNYDGANWDTNPAPLPAYSNNFSSKSWSEFSPKIGTVYHLSDKTTLRGSMGTGFKAPSVYELYTSLTRGKLYIECNSELKPEEILAYDIGVEHWFWERLYGTATFYQSFAKDFIGYDTISKTNWKRENISRMEIYGLETELKCQVTDDWSGFIKYTHNKSEIERYSPDSSVEGNLMSYTPHNKYGLGLSFNNPELFEANIIFNYKDTRYADDENQDKLGAYGTLDLKLLKDIGRFCQLSLDIENLLDKEYAVYVGTDEDTVAPGRMITGAVNIKF
ncbi:TonB-dependent receptor [Patescibacteria group bacterium]|nr:TonB-dependent receptor [Patescibacteria group bacterium]